MTGCKPWGLRGELLPLARRLSLCPYAGCDCCGRDLVRGNWEVVRTDNEITLALCGGCRFRVMMLDSDRITRDTLPLTNHQKPGAVMSIEALGRGRPDLVSMLRSGISRGYPYTTEFAP